MKIAVGVSGGVDSAVALYLLKKQGYEVTGFHMQCWDYQEEICTGEQDKADAAQVCGQLGIPFRFLDFQKEYQEKVIENFYSEYLRGRTPNPDVLCNREIKFGLFFDYAMSMGFDAVATGHYAKVQNGEMFVPKDLTKDQTYFLYRIRREKLPQVIFPLSELLKSEVREIAIRERLKPGQKTESMGICFIGKVNIRDFLKKKIPENPGKVVDSKGNVIGSHIGVPFYTIGQRHGFELSSYFGVPMYVINKRVEENLLIVGPEEETKRDLFSVSDINFLTKDDLGFGKRELLVRIRHLGEMIAAEVEFSPNFTRVLLSKKVFGIAPGQSCVLYSKQGQVIGGGIIEIPTES